MVVRVIALAAILGSLTGCMGFAFGYADTRRALGLALGPAELTSCEVAKRTECPKVAAGTMLPKLKHSADAAWQTSED